MYSKEANFSSTNIPSFTQITQQNSTSIPWSSNVHSVGQRQYPTALLHNYSQWKPWGRKRRKKPEIKTIRRNVDPSNNNVTRESPEEIARYIEERRKRWPGAKKVEQQNNHMSTHEQGNALQLVAQVYEEETDTEDGLPLSNKKTESGKDNRKENTKKVRNRGSGQVIIQHYRSNLFTLFVEKHLEKQHKLLLDFIRFLHRDKFLHI